MKGRTTAAAGVLLVVLAALAVACGRDGDGTDAGTDEQPTSRWLDLLAHVPDTAETRGWVVMNDYARARQAFGISLPESDADVQTLAEYEEQLMLDEQRAFRGFFPTEIAGLREIAPDEWRTELGFTFANVDQDVEAGEGPELHYVLRGRFDGNAIDEAVRSDPLFGDLLEKASHRGVDYYSWGEDFEADFSRTSAVRRLGRGHRLAHHGDYLYWAQWTDGLEGLIDTGLGERPSLADREHFQLLAEGLDRLDTYTALLTEDIKRQTSLIHIGLGERPSLADMEALQEALQREPRLLSYLAFATGQGVDAGGPYLAIVLLHADEETAAQNVQRLEQRIREGTSVFVSSGEPWTNFIDEGDISSEGRLVLAKLHTTEMMLWIQFVLARDPLLLH